MRNWRVTVPGKSLICGYNWVIMAYEQKLMHNLATLTAENLIGYVYQSI